MSLLFCKKKSIDKQTNFSFKLKKNICIKKKKLPSLIAGKKSLPSTLKHAHELTSWVSGAIGTPALLAQFYMYTFEQVS